MSKLWNSDDELYSMAERELSTCVVGDVMDKIGLQKQFLPPQIQPLQREMLVIGRAMPVLSVDVFAERTRYKVVDFRLPIEIGQVRVRPGDILFGDVDGVLLVPVEAEDEVFTRALEKARGEKLAKRAIEEGSSAVEIFKKFGIM